MFNKKSNFIPKYLTNFVSICRCNLNLIGLQSPLLVVTGDYMMRSHLEETKNKNKTKETQIPRPESQHAGHDKGPYLIKGHKRQAEV